MKQIQYILITIFLFVSILKVNGQSTYSNKLFNEGMKLYKHENYYDAAVCFSKCDSLDKLELPSNSTRREYGEMWLTACLTHGEEFLLKKYFPNEDYNIEYYDYPPIDRNLTIISDKYAEKGVREYKKGHLINAIKYIKKSSEIEKEILGDTCWFYGNSLLTLGYLYEEAKFTNEAKDCYIAAIDIFKKYANESFKYSLYKKALIQTNNFCSQNGIYPDIQDSTHRSYIEALSKSAISDIFNHKIEEGIREDSLAMELAKNTYGEKSLEYSNALFGTYEAWQLLSLVLKKNAELYELSKENCSVCLAASIDALEQSTLEQDIYVLAERLFFYYHENIEKGDSIKTSIKKRIESAANQLTIREKFRLYVENCHFLIGDEGRECRKIYFSLCDFAKNNALTTTKEYADLLEKISNTYLNENDLLNSEKYHLQSLEILKTDISKDQYFNNIIKYYSAMVLLCDENTKMAEYFLQNKANAILNYKGKTYEYIETLKDLAIKKRENGKYSEEIEIQNIIKSIDNTELQTFGESVTKWNRHTDVSITELLSLRDKIYQEEKLSFDYIKLTEKIYYYYKDNNLEKAINESKILIDYYSRYKDLDKSEVLKWSLQKAYCMALLYPKENYELEIDSMFIKYHRMLETRKRFHNENYNAYIEYGAHKYIKEDFGKATQWLKKASDYYTSSFLYMMLYTSFRYNNQIEEAELYFQKFCDYVFNDIKLNVTTSNTDERWKYWKLNERNLMRISRYAWKNPTDITCGNAYNSLLIAKGFLLFTEKGITDYIKESQNKELEKELNDIKRTNEKLIFLKKSKNVKDNEILTIEKELHSKEFNLLQNSGVRDFTKNIFVDWKEIQKSLGDKDIAIEFIEREFYKNKRGLLALILKKNYSAPKIIDVSEALNVYEDIKSRLGKNNSESIKSIYCSDSLYESLWGKLDKELNDINNIYFSPDGILNEIAIENLTKINETSLCKKNIYRLSSTRTLMDKGESKWVNAVLFGGIDYSNDLFSDNHMVNIPKHERGSVNSEELPGALEEINDIASLFAKYRVLPQIYRDTMATKSAFISLSGSDISILHIATHGQYIQNDSINIESSDMEDLSMTNSFLHLSFKQEEMNQTGRITAKEIAKLNFSKTDLVTLSACETGLGDLSLDGVLGLQRGFKKAGVKTILMSLWPINDIATKLLMKNFYQNIVEFNQSKVEALHNAKRYIASLTLDDLKDEDKSTIVNDIYGEIKIDKNAKIFASPYYWASFVLLDAIK